MDAYTHVIKRADPLRTALVFNCGQGAVRTTFAMVAACILRRKQLIERGLDDPFAPKTGSQRSGVTTVCVSADRIHCFKLKSISLPAIGESGELKSFLYEKLSS